MIFTNWPMSDFDETDPLDGIKYWGCTHSAGPGVQLLVAKKYLECELSPCFYNPKKHGEGIVIKCPPISKALRKADR